MHDLSLLGLYFERKISNSGAMTDDPPFSDERDNDWCLRNGLYILCIIANRITAHMILPQ